MLLEQEKLVLDNDNMLIELKNTDQETLSDEDDDMDENIRAGAKRVKKSKNASEANEI